MIQYKCPGWRCDALSKHCSSYLLTSVLLSVSVSVSVGCVNTVGLRLLRSVRLNSVLLHLLNHALLHWTLLWFPLKHRQVGSNETRLLWNLYRSVQSIFLKHSVKKVNTYGSLTFFLTRWEMSETGAVEACPLVEPTPLVDVPLIWAEDKPGLSTQSEK